MRSDDFLNDKNWQVVIDGEVDTWCDYKSEAIDRVIEIIKEESENEIKKFDFEGEVLILERLKHELEKLPEEDFYTILDELKKETDFIYDIKIYNISDKNEFDFLNDESEYGNYLDLDI